MEIHEMQSLFHIVEKAHGHPKLHGLRDWAMKQLEAEAEVLAKGRPEPKQQPITQAPVEGRRTLQEE